MAFFNIIIPTCGRPELERAVESVKRQTFKNWRLIVVHDGEANANCAVEDKYYHRIDCYIPEKRGAGGARNVGLRMVPKVSDEYTLFLDDDDEIANENVLEELYTFIMDAGCPDLVRLGYLKHYTSSGAYKLKLIDEKEKDIRVATKSSKVGPPTKCIKNCFVTYFPEGVKHQDVVQHILQCDNVSRCAVWDKPYFIYHIYDRPDKAKDSPESQKAKREIPKLLREIFDLVSRKESKEAALEWARRIEQMYS